MSLAPPMAFGALGCLANARTQPSSPTLCPAVAVTVAIAHGVAAAAADGGVVAVACDGDGLLLPLLLRHFAECPGCREGPRERSGRSSGWSDRRAGVMWSGGT